MLGNSMRYLQYYANELIKSERQDHTERISLAAENLERHVSETFKFLRSSESEHKMLIVQSSLKQSITAFDSLMKNEYNIAKSELIKINQLLVDRIIEFAGTEL
jgi:hypothetical protein